MKKIITSSCVLLISVLQCTFQTLPGGTISTLFSKMYSLYTTNMGTPPPGLLSTEVSATPSWTEKEQAIGKELVYSRCVERTEEILMINPLLVNFKDNHHRGTTALIWAAHLGHTEIVQALLAARADLNIQDNCGWTALMKAAEAYVGRTKIANKLIAAGAQVNIQNNNGKTALMCAAFGGHTAIVHSLLTAGAQVNVQTNDGLTALMGAAHEGQKEILQALLAARAHSTIPDNNGRTALEIAQKRGHTDIVELLQSHVDIESEEETLMVKPALSELME